MSLSEPNSRSHARSGLSLRRDQWCITRFRFRKRVGILVTRGPGVGKSLGFEDVSTVRSALEAAVQIKRKSGTRDQIALLPENTQCRPCFKTPRTRRARLRNSR
jgi:hypothetical protein